MHRPVDEGKHEKGDDHDRGEGADAVAMIIIVHRRDSKLGIT
jgi:hypothetical protein